MSIRNQLLIMVFVPFIGLFILGNTLVGSQVRQLLDARSVETSTRQAVQISHLIHALQVERGQSAGFLASSGVNFVNDLPQTRGKTDAALQALSGDLRGQLPDLAELQTTRETVDALGLTVPQMAGFYTSNIRQSIHIADELFFHLKDPEILRLGAGFMAMTEAKEAAGLQRAAGATGLSAGRFLPKVFNAFVERGAIEGKFLALARIELGPLLDSFDFAQLQAQSGITALRQTIVETGVNAAPEGLTAKEWFATSTAWIDALHSVEAEVTSSIVGKAHASYLSAVTWLIATLLVAVGLAGLALYLGWRVVRSVNKGFTGLENAMKRLGEKDFDTRDREPDLRTEVGRLFAAIDKTREELRASDEILVTAETQRNAVLSDMERALSQLSNKDLDCKLPNDFPEEFSALQTSFDVSVEHLSGAIAEFSSAVSAINGASQTLDVATNDMSQRTSSQAASLEQISAALSELSMRVDNAANLASETDMASKLLKKEAGFGKQTVEETLPIVEDIARVSEKMAGMVTLIDDIAFQTNLLALNAGVEAARAGEAGQGFAVVAGEVRSLAVQAGDTASEINGLIRETMETVKNGVDMVHKTAQALNRIDQSADDATRAVSEVKIEAEAQALSLSEIRSAVTSLDTDTQRNASMVEECTGMAAALGRKATDANSMIASFRLPGDMSRPVSDLPEEDRKVA